MRKTFKWVCAFTTVLIGTGTVGAGGTPEPITAADATVNVDPTYPGAAPRAEEIETAYASGHLPACAFAALVGCF